MSHKKWGTNDLTWVFWRYNTMPTDGLAKTCHNLEPKQEASDQKGLCNYNKNHGSSTIGPHRYSSQGVTFIKSSTLCEVLGFFKYLTKKQNKNSLDLALDK